MLNVQVYRDDMRAFKEDKWFKRDLKEFDVLCKVTLAAC